MEQKKFLKGLCANIAVRPDKLYEMITNATSSTGSILRVYQFLSGELDEPVEFNDKDRVKVNFKSYDVLTDTVKYWYIRKQTRYFRSVADAEEYKTDGTVYEYAPGSYSCTDNYQIARDIMFKVNNSCSLEDWNNNTFKL
jgi:hypothetical protein